LSEADKIKRYKKLVEKHTPNSRLLRDCLRAFWVGGLICCVGQCISIFGDKVLKLNLLAGGMFTPSVLVFLGTTLTGLGIYDRIGEYAGAGSIVPITGFANSVAAPAMEFRREGLILGLGAKLFLLAGPVITYGVTTSIVIGVIYYAIDRWFS
jgi:stage V sporulation protein AC